ncbi:MAG: outer membrane beta-barrel protein [Flavobacteriales bacterium]|nr:outer membrane beta-barrel protein [Flavobacteriales bacterium]
MKYSIILITLCASFLSFGQHKREYTGLNKFIPNGYDVGMKANANYYFSGVKSVPGTSNFAEAEGEERIGGGLGFYGHFYLSEKVGIQTELNAHYRSGYLRTFRGYKQDSMRTISNEEITNYSTVFFEIPIYLKFRWEFTPIHKGNWKADSRLGLFVGPRLTFNAFSNSTVARATTTDSYDNVSLSVANDATSLGRVNRFFGVGASLGLDYEVWNGFLVHASYFRGFLNHFVDETGAKAFENRVEVGIGYRFR